MIYNESPAQVQIVWSAGAIKTYPNYCRPIRRMANMVITFVFQHNLSLKRGFYGRYVGTPESKNCKRNSPLAPCNPRLYCRIDLAIRGIGVQSFLNIGRETYRTLGRVLGPCTPGPSTPGRLCAAKQILGETDRLKINCRLNFTADDWSHIWEVRGRDCL